MHLRATKLVGPKVLSLNPMDASMWASDVLSEAIQHSPFTRIHKARHKKGFAIFDIYKTLKSAPLNIIGHFIERNKSGW